MTQIKAILAAARQTFAKEETETSAMLRIPVVFLPVVLLTVVLLTVLATAPLAAQTRPGSDVQLVPEHLTLESAAPFDLKGCILQGGRVDTYPFSGEQSCNLPTIDGGQACHTGADCESYCMTETHTCLGYQSLGAGCHGFIDEDGTEVVMCID